MRRSRRFILRTPHRRVNETTSDKLKSAKLTLNGQFRILPASKRPANFMEAHNSPLKQQSGGHSQSLRTPPLIFSRNPRRHAYSKTYARAPTVALDSPLHQRNLQQLEQRTIE